jgi:hypothetical protein
MCSNSKKHFGEKNDMFVVYLKIKKFVLFRAYWFVVHNTEIYLFLHRPIHVSFLIFCMLLEHMFMFIVQKIIFLFYFLFSNILPSILDRQQKEKHVQSLGHFVAQDKWNEDCSLIDQI